MADDKKNNASFMSFWNWLGLLDRTTSRMKHYRGGVTKRNSARPTLKAKAKIRRKMARLSRRKNRAA